MIKKSIILIQLIFIFSCAPKKRIPVSIFYPKKIKFVQIGYASWYGKKFHGRPTASGEIFNMYKLTAAHRTLPLGTYVKVTNLSNGKSVIVKINDRGPYVKGRIIDLSYMAAKKIGMVKKGVQKVKIEVISLPYYVRKYRSIFEYKKIYSVQVGAFRLKKNAKNLIAEIKRYTNHAFYRKVKINGTTIYRVYAGKYNSKTRAKYLMKKLSYFGYDGFTVEIDE